MKKMQKKVVIATSVSVASMLLNAACGYGPPVEPAVDYNNSNSSYEVTTSDDSNKDVSSALESIDSNYEIEPEEVYGPPVSE